MAMELFRFVDCLFDKNLYQTVTNQDKKSNFFMVQRYMSIRFPIEANFFNVAGIDEVQAMDHWHRVLSKKYNRKPSWVFTKTKKKEKEKRKIDDIKNETINLYLKIKKLNRRDFNFLVTINHDKIYEVLKRLDASIKNNSDILEMF